MTSKKICVARVCDERIYVCQMNEAYEGTLEFSKVARGSNVAVAFDRTGEPHLARTTREGDLFVAPLEHLEAETFLSGNVSSFDIVRPGELGKSTLVCVYVRGGSTFLRECKSGLWQEEKELRLCLSEPVVRVRFARGNALRSILVATGASGKNYVFEAVEEPQIEASLGVACSARVV